MPREHVNKAAAIFTKCLTAYVAVAASGGHSELCPSASLHPHLITNKLALFRDTHRLPMKIMLGLLRNRVLSWLK